MPALLILQFIHVHLCTIEVDFLCKAERPRMIHVLQHRKVEPRWRGNSEYRSSALWWLVKEIIERQRGQLSSPITEHSSGHFNTLELVSRAYRSNGYSIIFAQLPFPSPFATNAATLSGTLSNPCLINQGSKNIMHELILPVHYSKCYSQLHLTFPTHPLFLKIV